MPIIMIDVECKDGIITRHFCTVVSDASKIHKALMDSVNFIKSIGWLYIEHTITVHEQRENVLKKGADE